MIRMKLKIGDIFSVNLDESKKKYFQYICRDSTQLDSEVIRVFKNSYSIDESPELSKIVDDTIDFYAHVILKFGVEMNLWHRIGNITEIGDLTEVIFRNSRDYGNPEIKISNNWWIWRVNEKRQSIGNLTDLYKKADIGIIVLPKNIVNRMQNGKYNFVYPDYE